MKRVKVKGTGVRPRSNPDEEPDFWNGMPWVVAGGNCSSCRVDSHDNTTKGNDSLALVGVVPTAVAPSSRYADAPIATNCPFVAPPPPQSSSCIVSDDESHHSGGSASSQPKRQKLAIPSSSFCCPNDSYNSPDAGRHRLLTGWGKPFYSVDIDAIDQIIAATQHQQHDEQHHRHQAPLPTAESNAATASCADGARPTFSEYNNGSSNNTNGFVGEQLAHDADLARVLDDLLEE